MPHSPSTRGKSRRTPIQLALTCGALLTWACTETGSGDSAWSATGELDQMSEALLVSIADDVLAPAYAEFELAAADLEESSQALTDALADGSGDPIALRSAAQLAWQDTMLSWQAVESMQLGPVGNSSRVVGGQDLRDEIYSWPTVNSCRVDQELVLGDYGAPDFTDTRLVNVYGLDSVEYLLFWTDPANSCAPQLEINSNAQWEGLGAAEVEFRRAEYATAIAADIANHARELSALWQPGGEFNDSLINTGGSSHYASNQVAMNEIMRAMFYAETSVKDAKLGSPAGLFNCGSTVCLETLESQYAGLSKQEVLHNLRGLRLLFTGGPDPSSAVGFDDLLNSMGEDLLAVRMLNDLDSAISMLEALPGTLRESLLADEASLDLIHAALGRFTDDLEGEFATALTLQVPTEAAGDAD